MHKYQKYRSKKKEFQSIAALQNNLFDQLQSVNEPALSSFTHDPFFNEFGENEPLEQRQDRHLLNKAKTITSNNRGRIEKIKRQIVKLEEGERGDFMTGVALFERERPFEEREPVDEGAMLRSLGRGGGDDLEELRRMIKKTEKNLRMYSQSVYKTQSKVVDVADRCGWELDTGLAIKINRCNLDQVHSRNAKPKTAGENIRRRTMTSYNPKRSRAD